MKRKKYSKNNVIINLDSSIKGKSLFKNKGFWGLIIVVIMIGSVISFSAYYSDNNSNQNQIEYNVYKFVNRGNGWETVFNGQVASFFYSPQEVQDITVNNINLNTNEVYFVIESKDINEYSYEINRIKSFLTLKGINSYVGCLDKENCGDYPLVNCLDNKVIIFRTSEKNLIYNEEECVIIEGQTTDYMLVVDRFIYYLYGVI